MNHNLKWIVLIPIILIVTSCKTMPDAETTVVNWGEALVDGDIESLMDTYWDDAVMVFKNPDGDDVQIVGAEAIRESQSNWFQSRPANEAITVELRESKEEGDSVICKVILIAGGPEFVNTLEMVSRDGEWKILRQVVGLDS